MTLVFCNACSMGPMTETRWHEHERTAEHRAALEKAGSDK